MKSFVRASGLSALRALPFVLAALPVAVSFADDDASQVTYHKDVEPLIQKHCQGCHRPDVTTGGTTAPMTFMSYEEVRPWAKSIMKAIDEGAMPPWHAAPAFHGVFANERTLSDAEKATIRTWIGTGAPRGNPAHAPAPRVFAATRWMNGEPDLVVTMPEPFLVKDEVEDLYQNFSVTITEEMLPEPRWIKGIEFLPGSGVVHHIIGYAIEPGQGTKGADRGDRGMLGGIAPGNEPDRFPAGFGKRLSPGTRVVFAMHYHKEAGAGTAVEDQSSVGFQFFGPDERVRHAIVTEAIGNSSFEIPPGHPNWPVGSAKVFEKDVYVLSLMPHMHLRGKDALYTAYYPDGTKEVLLDVPRYDFNWQTGYVFKEPRLIPAGTRIEVMMHFDNSTNNAANPDPNVSIRFGGPTTDEMMLGWVDWADAKPLDAAGDGSPGAKDGKVVSSR